jgi:hypothetical protein
MWKVIVVAFAALMTRIKNIMAAIKSKFQKNKPGPLGDGPELLAVLYLLYAMECIKWLAPGEQVFTRKSANGWAEHRPDEMSYKLLGRMPLLVDPLLFRPGFLRVKGSVPQARLRERALRRTAHRLNNLWITDLLCRLQAMLLLLYVPAVVALHRLSAMWPLLLGAILTNHVLLMVAFYIALRRFGCSRMLAAIGPLLLNPLGATRAMEALSQVIFDREIVAAKARRSAAGH